MTSRLLPQEVSTLEARFGLRVGAALTERSALPQHDIAERLRVAREQALARARSARTAGSVVQTAAETQGVMAHANCTLSLGRAGGDPFQGGRWALLASFLPLLLLVLGLVLIDTWHDRVQSATVAEVDTALLADDLPPDAYTDPGFTEYLKTGQP